MDTIPTLADLLRERRLLDHHELVEVFVPVLEGLEQAHREGRVHGDIKPARIERQLDGSYRLAGYGAGKLGTPRYMSPEKVRGEKLDPRSDVYSLGAVMFEALTGRSVFEAEVNRQIMDAHAATEPPRPGAIRPDVPAELEQLILKTLAKRREERFQTARELAAALAGTASAVPKPVPAAPGAVTAPRPKPVKPRTVPRTAAVVPAPAAAAAPVRPRLAAVGPVRPRTSSRAWLLPLAAVLVVGLGIIGTLSVMQPRVPELTGIAVADAEALLRGRGLVPETGEAIDDTLAPGLVARQSPAPGRRIAKGRTVELRPSTGMVAVPELASVEQDDAIERLRRLGLAAGAVEQQYSDNVPAGLVLQAVPRPGLRVRSGSAISLTVAAGRATCPSCGKRRERGDAFCTRCGHRFEAR